MDRADGGGAPSLRDAAAGRPGGDRPRQEAEGGQGHPLPGPGWVWPVGQCPFDHSQSNIFVSLRALIDQKGKRKKNVSPGVFDECDTEADVLRWSRSNVFLLHDMGIFTALLELLSMEIE